MNGNDASKNLGEIVSEVSEKASLLVRQEIDLAKAEVIDKASKLGRGAAAAAAAGVVLIFGVTMLFHTFAWLLVDLFSWETSVWFGFLIVTIVLFLVAALAGFLAYRFFKKGSPPVPQMAIEQAKLTRADFEGQKIERDQVGRSLQRGEEVKA